MIVVGREGGQRNHRNLAPAMARDLKAMFREAFELPESERATLAGLLIESPEPPPDPEVEELWAEEAERRWREIESGDHLFVTAVAHQSRRPGVLAAPAIG